MARGRKALSVEEKIERAAQATPTQAQTDFAEWIEATTGLDVDIQTLIAVQKLYPIFLETPEASAAREERKAEAEKKRIEREAKSLDSFMERAKKLGFVVEKVTEETAE